MCEGVLMMFSSEELLELENTIKTVMSDHRYTHTIGVRDAAKKIAQYCYVGDISELVAAALLHDISKEYSVEKQMEIMQKMDVNLKDSDLMSEQIFHSFTAPYVIKNEYKKFSTTNILSAVLNHTTGNPNMSLFDEIIFIADYVEDNRKYLNCVNVREKLYDAFNSSDDREECVAHLHKATISALELTIIDLLKNGRCLNERTVATRNAFLSRVPMPVD